MDNLDKIFKNLNHSNERPNLEKQWSKVEGQLEAKRSRKLILIIIPFVGLILSLASSNQGQTEFGGSTKTEELISSRINDFEVTANQSITVIEKNDQNTELIAVKPQDKEKVNEFIIKSNRNGINGLESNFKDALSNASKSQPIISKEGKSDIDHIYTKLGSNNILDRKQKRITKIPKITSLLKVDDLIYQGEWFNIEPVSSKLTEDNWELSLFNNLYTYSNDAAVDFNNGIGVSLGYKGRGGWIFITQLRKAKMTGIYSSDFDERRLVHPGLETYLGSLQKVNLSMESLELSLGAYKQLRTFSNTNVRLKISADFSKIGNQKYQYTYRTIYSEEVLDYANLGTNFYFSGIGLGLRSDFFLLNKLALGMEGNYHFFMNKEVVDNPNRLNIDLFLSYTF